MPKRKKARPTRSCFSDDDEIREILRRRIWEPVAFALTASRPKPRPEEGSKPPHARAAYGALGKFQRKCNFPSVPGFPGFPPGFPENRNWKSDKRLTLGSWWRYGRGISSCLQMARTVPSLISRWRGTLAILCDAELNQMLWAAPSRYKAQPCWRRWRSNSASFMLPRFRLPRGRLVGKGLFLQARAGTVAPV